MKNLCFPGMKNSISSFILFSLLFVFLLNACANQPAGGSPVNGSGQSIIADHTIVNQYGIIPQHWIDEVKKMWFNVPGESHSQAYRTGLELLQQTETRFAVNIVEGGSPEGYTNIYLRVSRAVRNRYSGWDYSTGENVFWTYVITPSDNLSNIIRDHIAWCATNNLTVGAIGFGWCWDLTRSSASPDADPVYGCHWYGSIDGNDSGWWGLDAGDSAVNCDTYCRRVDEYNDFCRQNSYGTKVFFTTGPVDSYSGESGYQGYLKHEYIRNYVRNNGGGRVLFDYADILCYNDDGSSNFISWNGHSYPVITASNIGAADIGHIGTNGAVRLAKATWWMLARIAGWDGNP